MGGSLFKPQGRRIVHGKEVVLSNSSDSLLQTLRLSPTAAVTVVFVLLAHAALIMFMQCEGTSRSFSSAQQVLYVSMLEDSQSAAKGVALPANQPKYPEETPSPLKTTPNKPLLKPQAKKNIEKPVVQQAPVLVPKENIHQPSATEQSIQPSQTTSGGESAMSTGATADTTGNSAASATHTGIASNSSTVQGGNGSGRTEGTGNHYKTVQISQLRFRNAVKPEYPLSSRQSNETGLVEVRVKIDINGNVVNAAVNRSSGYERLDNAALTAAEQSSFHPYIEDGIVRQTVALIPYNFNLTPSTRWVRW